MAKRLPGETLEQQKERLRQVIGESKEDRERRLKIETARRTREKHREALNKKQKEYRATSKAKELKRVWRNKPENKEKSRVYNIKRKTHRDHLYNKYRWSMACRARVLCVAAAYRAKKAGIPYSLTMAKIEAVLIQGVCQASGLAFVFDVPSRQRSPWSPSLDRRDPQGGYTDDNVWVVCWSYNAAKGRSSDADVMKLARALVGSEAS